MTLLLQIGNVVLSDFEVPSEIGDLGGRQTIVKHEFPGGLITITPLGAFPDPISWSGILTGADAISRSQQLDRIRALGDAVMLSYGPMAWSGVVTSYKPKPRHQWYIPYTIQFEPIADLSGVGNVPFSPIDANTLLALQVTALNSLTEGIDGLLPPANLIVAANTLLDAVSGGLLNGDGTVAGIATADQQAISVAAVNLETLALPYSQGTDPTMASPALDMSVRATTINQTVTQPVTSVRVVRAVNPNLYQVAQQYLGDATLWIDIANASGLPPDPLPVGTFTLTVPTS